MQLKEQLANLPAELTQRLRARGFSPEHLEALANNMHGDRQSRNRLTGRVEAPMPDDVVDAPSETTGNLQALAALGAEALRRGEVALCVLAGGMATRMGGVVKALVPVLDKATFLDLRLRENEFLRRKYGACVPLWLMTSEATEGAIRQALGNRVGEDICSFEQCVSLRLTPEGHLFVDEAGHPSVYATGHGDLPDALRRTPLLEGFIRRGGRYIWIANLDNLGATIDAALLGLHIQRGAHLTVEVVDKVGSDRGGVPVRYEGRRIITEEFRLPLSVDSTQVRVFNTNTFLVNARDLADLTLDWTYVEVAKKLGDRTAIQFERLLGEMTMAIEPAFVRVPREGNVSRFLPIKDMDELSRRTAEVEQVARYRGML